MKAARDSKGKPEESWSKTKVKLEIARQVKASSHESPVTLPRPPWEKITPIAAPGRKED